MFMMEIRKSSSISREPNALEAWRFIVIILLSDSLVSSEAPRLDVSSALQQSLQPFSHS